MTDFTLLTALAFETRIAKSLGLRRVRSLKKTKAFQGTVSGLSVALVEIGVKGKKFPVLKEFSQLLPERGIISVGLAGGLDPSLTAATVLVPEMVLFEGKPYPCDPFLVGTLERAGALRVPLLLTSKELLADPSSKRRAARESGADAVDMESGIVAAWALGSSLAFASLRALSDPLEASLPGWFIRKEKARALAVSAKDFLILALRAVRARRRLTKVLASALELLTRPRLASEGESNPFPDTT